MKTRRCALALVATFVLFAGTTGHGDRAVASAQLPHVPMDLPPVAADGQVYLPDGGGKLRATTIDADLQNHLTAFIAENSRPLAAVVVVDVKTGSILALAQGKQPDEWGGRTHAALHTGFPAASLFKTVVTSAAFEVADLDANDDEVLQGGCSNVRPTGDWQQDQPAPAPKNSRRAARGGGQMTLRRAYGSSCNGFFAKIAINDLGLGIITDFAKRLGWEFGVPTDFHLEKSPFLPPSVHNTSTATVGRFAAGFGHVGISAVHAAWLMMVTAHGGKSVPLRLFKDTPPLPLDQAPIMVSNPDQNAQQIAGATLAAVEKTTAEGTPTVAPEIKDAQAKAAPEGEGIDGAEPGRIFSEKTARRILDVMEATVHGGTGNQVFSPRGRYRKLRDLAGGKTGTLTGSSPRGLTTLFTGLVPLQQPEIAVAAVVLLEGRWRIKATTLAAEAMHAYLEKKMQASRAIDTAVFLPVAAGEGKGAAR